MSGNYEPMTGMRWSGVSEQAKELVYKLFVVDLGLSAEQIQYKKSKELPKCTGLFLLDKPIEYLSDYPNVLRTSITVAIKCKNIYSVSFYHHF